MFNPLRNVGRAALDLLYPPLCLGCKDRLPPHDTATLPLCALCQRHLPSPDPGAVEVRLARLPGGAEGFGHVLALWTFDAGGVMQALQHALKYADRPTLGVQAGGAVGAAWRAAGRPLPDFVVPVPLHRTRRLERGYNQSERLAQGIAATLGAEARPDTLVRTRRTRSQTALARGARQQNVAGAFACPDPTALAGRRVLLVDDVVTTGATALAAAEPLRAAGAAVDLTALAVTRE